MREPTLAALRLGVVPPRWPLATAVVPVLRTAVFATPVVNRSTTAPRREQRPSAASGTAPDPSSLRTDPAVTTPSLVVTAGPLRGTSLTLGSTPILIGRAPECTLVLDDDYASNRHARIFRREDRKST